MANARPARASHDTPHDLARVEAPPAAVVVRASATMLRQAVENLLDNAASHGGAGAGAARRHRRAVQVGGGRDHHAELLRGLSERERQILTLLARGYSNRRIAESCHLSVNTVRTHVQNVLIKLGVHSKLEAVALAVGRGLVPAGDPRDR